MGKPAIPQSKSPLLKALPCPAPIISISWTETPLFGTNKGDLHARFLAHTFVQQLYQDQPGQAHDMLSHEIHM